jgi:AcrR family transcriptional regulator
MPKVTEKYREARREEITAAALRCFATHGFAGTSMADIIAESGLSAGAIYGHFDSKHGIMMAVAKQVIEGRISDLREFTSGGRVPSPGDVVAYMLPGLTRNEAQPALLLQVWGQAMVEEGMRELLWEVFSDLQETYRTYFEAWAVEHDGLDEPAAALWADSLVHIALGLGQGYIVQSAVFPDFDSDTYLEAARRLLPR